MCVTRRATKENDFEDADTSSSANVLCGLATECAMTRGKNLGSTDKRSNAKAREKRRLWYDVLPDSRWALSCRTSAEGRDGRLLIAIRSVA